MEFSFSIVLFIVLYFFIMSSGKIGEHILLSSVVLFSSLFTANGDPVDYTTTNSNFFSSLVDIAR